MTVSLVPLEALDASEVIDVISAAFGRPRTHEWFQWKHVEGPWGPSIGLGAVENGRLLGVRLLLPWGLCVDGSAVQCFRAVEAATHPDAQGRGLFGNLNAELMATVSASGPTVLFSTPNESSRRSYRRLGWSWLGPIAHRYAPVVPMPSRRVARAGAWEAPAFPGTSEGVATSWDERSWRWRTDPRCGHVYTTSWIRRDDGTHGLSYRITTAHGLRCVLVLASWGRPGLARRAARAVSQHERAPLVLEATGRGASRPVGRAGRIQGGSLLAVWTSDDALLGAARSLASWHVGLADLEGVL